MKKTMLHVVVSVLLIGLFALTGCGGGGNSNTLTIGTQGENLAFDKTTLTAPANTQVTLTFKNNAASLQHDWVLVNGGDDVASQVDQDAASQPNYVPQGNANVIATTQLLNGGASETITFTTPGPGSYTYLCTVPGHYPSMKGTLTVQ